jgi:hypothetical protein
MYRCLIALLMLATTATSAAPAWTWVDAEGRRHFSDRPVAGATRIDLPDSAARPSSPVSATAPAADGRRSATAPPQTPAAPARYTRFDVLSPSNEETLWNIGATLSVDVAIEPGLQQNHILDAVLDGQRIGLTASTTPLTIPEVYRGMHTIQAVIVDAATGEEVLRTQPVTVMVQQTSLLNPGNPNRPAR